MAMLLFGTMLGPQGVASVIRICVGTWACGVVGEGEVSTLSLQFKRMPRYDTNCEDLSCKIETAGLVLKLEENSIF